MHIQSLCIKNFRRLKNVRIDLDKDTTIFVGANNSGKTSAAQALQAFLGTENERVNFSIYDFSADCWDIFDKVGNGEADPETPLPTITLDLWFSVDDSDLHYVIKLLPSLDWKHTLVGVRMEFAPKDASRLLSKFREEKAHSEQHGAAQKANGRKYQPWPATLTDYLKRHLRDEYKVVYSVLDPSFFDKNFVQQQAYVPSLLGDGKENGAAIMRTLLRVDFLTAQRHQVDSESSGKASRLARRLGETYKHDLKSNQGGFEAAAALAESEEHLNTYVAKIFEPTLSVLNTLGYPGFADPSLVIMSDLNPQTILTENARIHYQLRDSRSVDAKALALTLPDKYNGLGFKNLIYMAIEVLEAQRRWVELEEDRPPLHLLIIEEPEAHLHVQLQQAFIRQIRKILKEQGDDSSFLTQLVVTTHSPHIIYEKSFGPIRYFRRSSASEGHHYSKVLNLSELDTPQPTREFLLKYMRLTHCDLFFADAAILVEGTVERLLLPSMIDRDAQDLKMSYLSIIEVGGAFAHKFKDLVDFLGLPTLIITDLDSVSVRPSNPKKSKTPKPPSPTSGEVTMFRDNTSNGDDDVGTGSANSRAACMASKTNAVTSNQTLIQWLPKLTKVTDLLAATDDAKVSNVTDDKHAKVRVAYQTKQTVSWWKNQTEDLAGRTFEDAFAFANLLWCQAPAQEDLGLAVKTVAKSGQTMDLKKVAEEIDKHVRSDGFDKTRFALALLMSGSDDWKTPAYIREGLCWLRDQLFPAAEATAPDQPKELSGQGEGEATP